MFDELKKYFRKEPTFKDGKFNTYWRFSFMNEIVVLIDQSNLEEEEKITQSQSQEEYNLFRILKSYL